jgi:hypothetical protein
VVAGELPSVQPGDAVEVELSAEVTPADEVVGFLSDDGDLDSED